MERSLLSCKRCFIPLLIQRQLLNRHGADIIYKYLEFFENAFNPKIDAIIYLRTTPQVLYDRIQSRNRPGEQNISIEYLQQLNTLYDNWLLNEREIKVYIIDANETTIDISNQISNILRQL